MYLHGTTVESGYLAHFVIWRTSSIRHMSYSCLNLMLSGAHNLIKQKNGWGGILTCAAVCVLCMCISMSSVHAAQGRPGRLRKVVYITPEQLIWPCLPIQKLNTQAGAPSGGTWPTTKPSLYTTKPFCRA